jgi:hypothetical protein
LGSRLRKAILKEYDENYQCYVARKMWLELRRGWGIDVARCTVERLMKTLGLQGAHRGKSKPTTVPAPGICQVKWDTSVQFIWGWASGWLIQAWVGMAGGRGRRPNRAGLAW